MKKILAAPLAALALVAPYHLYSQTAAPSTATQAVGQLDATAQVNARPALWIVKDKDTTIYLFGTIHLMRQNTNWFRGKVKSAYDDSSEVVLEIVDGEDPQVAGMTMQRAIDPDGPPLTKKLGEKGAKNYEAMMKTLGLPVAAFEKYEPWFVSVAVSILPMQRAGYDPNSGVDKILFNAAKKDGKRLIGLETTDQQLGFLDGMPEDQQVAMLNEAIRQAPDGEKIIDSMVDAWAKGDIEKLAKLMNAGMKATPQLEKALLIDRNASWAEWIDNRLDQPGNVFLAVGAGHLAGKNSVQEFLKLRKIKVARLKVK